MAYTTSENGKIFFHDQTKNDEKIFLVDFMSSEANRSIVSSHQFISAGMIYPLATEISKIAQKFQSGEYGNFVNAVIFYRILAELLRKPQVNNILHVGSWSEIDEVLNEILPKFNDKNFLYCLTDRKPLQNFSHTKFIFTEGKKYFLPENKFETIIFSGSFPPPSEIILAAKNFGKIYFFCNEKIVPEEIRADSEIFTVAESFALFELTATSRLKKIISERTEEGILAKKKSEIAKIIYQIPKISAKLNSLHGEEKTAAVDEFIGELVRIEKILAEIFPYLRSDTVKFNLNLLKEFLIDFRLRIDDAFFWKISSNKFANQYKILVDDMKKDFG